MSENNAVTVTSRAGDWVLKPTRGAATKSKDSPNEPSSSSAPRTIKQHPKFFFDNVLVAIQIEDTIFNVHKYQLAKSEVFSDMFKVPKPEGDEPEEGSSPEHPIIINGVAASDFAALLTVLYAGQFSSNQPTPDAPLIIPAFRLANMFNFSELRTFLLPLAEKNLDDVDKIVFAREFDIKLYKNRQGSGALGSTIGALARLGESRERHIHAPACSRDPYGATELHMTLLRATESRIDPAAPLWD